MFAYTYIHVYNMLHVMYVACHGPRHAAMLCYAMLGMLWRQWEGRGVQDDYSISKESELEVA